jgi:hypothetical protein
MAGKVKQLAFSEGLQVGSPPIAAQVSRIEVTDTTGWDGATVTSVTYDVSSYTDDARPMLWVLKSETDGYAPVQGLVIDHPTQTQVRVTSGDDFKLDAGTYLLVGV